MHSKSQNQSNEKLFVDKFVGREELLAIVDEAVADSSNNHVITFVGEGGVGKTALLRRIYKEYAKRKELILVKFDLIEAGLETFGSVLEDMINQFYQDGFFSEQDVLFWQKLQEPIQKALSEGKPEEEIYQLQYHAEEEFLTYYHKVLRESGRRVMVISDTTELADHQVFTDAVRFTSKELFQNAVLIWAGRPTDTVMDYFQHILPDSYDSSSWKVHEPIHLGYFTLAETTRYFNKYLPSPLKPDLIETIHILTEGKPILLALTMEWFKHYIDLPKHVHKSKEELEAFEPLKLRMFRKHFEMALVRRVRAVRSPLDKALLFLSFLDRRYDKRILQLALDRPMEYIEELESQLRQMAFIRSFLDDSSGLLHDEAKNLINKYAWPPYDPKRTDRRLLARKVIDGFYLPEIVRLRAEATAILKDASGVPLQVPQELLAHELEIECLDYHYRISLDEGRHYVTRLIGEGVSLRKREGMRHEITRCVNEHEAKVAVARMEIRRGQYEGVREVLEGVLKEEGISLWYKTTLLRELSEVPVDPEEKTAYLRQAISIAEQAKDQLEAARIYNALGLMYRRQGLWADAEKAYQETLRRLKDVDDDQVPDERAFTLNNLAYVKLLQGDLDLAESLADIALEMHDKPRNQIGMAFSHLTKGEIAEFKDYLEKARNNYEEAERLFRTLGKGRYQATALVNLSRIKRIEGDFETAEKLLTAGLRRPLGEEVRTQAEREQGALYRTDGMPLEDPLKQLEKFKAAIEAFQKSLETSKLKRDSYGQAQALYDLIFMEFITKGTINQAYTAQLNTILAKHNYPIIKAQLDELHADDLYKQGEIMPAFESYINVANTLSKRHLRKYNNMLASFKRKFLEQPRDTQKELYDYFQEIIAELPPGSRLHSSLRSLCVAFQIAY